MLPVRLGGHDKCVAPNREAKQSTDQPTQQDQPVDPSTNHQCIPLAVQIIEEGVLMLATRARPSEQYPVAAAAVYASFGLEDV